MSDIPKVTKEIIEGKKPVPKGYELKKVHHDEYTYQHPASGKMVTVKAHDEHFLKEIKKEAKKPAAGGTGEKPAVDNQHISKKAARKAAEAARRGKK